LFNNLNVLSALLFQDVYQAGEFLQQFSKVYRYVLQDPEKEVVPVAAELDFMEPYAHLLRARFRGSLRIDIAVAGHPAELLHRAGRLADAPRKRPEAQRQLPQPPPAD
jgi:LytS/YehU family sensor histidine kinase